MADPAELSFKSRMDPSNLLTLPSWVMDISLKGSAGSDQKVCGWELMMGSRPRNALLGSRPLGSHHHLFVSPLLGAIQSLIRLIHGLGNGLIGAHFSHPNTDGYLQGDPSLGESFHPLHLMP